MPDLPRLNPAIRALDSGKPAFVTFSPGAESLGYVAAFVVGGMILVNMGYTTYVWLSYRSDYAALKASFALIPRGSFVLVGQSIAQHRQGRRIAGRAEQQGRVAQ